MKRKNRKLFNSQEGFALIEVVASLVIITIVLLSFFGLLIQSNKTGKSSEQIIDATYLAQKEMEKMYNYFKSTKIETWESNFPYAAEKDEVNSTGNTTKYKVTPFNAKNKEVIIVNAEDMSPDKTVRITIEVYDSRGEVLKAKVQNIFSF
ncbi:type IV pilus modification PilV family protein [Lysinibacillus xylanilyticus]|uniref:type IV pilus modification PilV family protein n=1 Tax=Lysinibacillus xylanilyticus TaxID=582475 RepID=UPI000670C0D5|nr:prepilin-type N-terminal cleavage/methylation domain-containing protein [Lysinibacillus xylanilyticus]